ncbi:MAG: DUF1176 domain-containing protein [Cyanobacteria bacterium P01_F01_bin.150]
MRASRNNFQNNESNYSKRFSVFSLRLLLILSLMGCQAPLPTSTNTPPESEGVKDAISFQQDDTNTSSYQPSTTTDITFAQKTESQSTSQSTFEGGGFTVTITGFGSEATYRGCNAQQECLDIAQPAHYVQGSYTWENGDYSYVMSPVATETGDVTSGDYYLRVYGPDYSSIVDAVVSPVAGSLGDTALKPTVLAEFYNQADALEVCPEHFDTEISQRSSFAYTVNGDDAIVEIQCFLAAYQGAYEYWFYQTTESGGEFMPLSFDTYTKSESGELSRIQMRELGGLPTYDPAKETLTIFTKYRGLSDCGSYSEYQWQGSEFELVTYREKPNCDGNAIAPTEYPQVYP